MPSIVYAVVIFAIMAGLYCLSYHMNHNTPKPKGCEHLKDACDGCKLTSCMNHPVHDKKGE